MKRKTVFLKRYVAIPMLGFLPFIIGIIIFLGIWNYNENEGFRHLAAIQAKVKSEYEEADGDWRIFGNNLSTFLVSNSDLGQLLILDEDFDVIFPENELLREVRKTISEEFKIAFAEGKLENKSVLHSSDGKTYRAALSSMKGTDSRLMYILSYSEMRWENNNIRHLSRLAIGLSFLISLGITFMLYLYEQSAQRSALLADALKETIERKQQKEEKEHTLQYSINHYLQNHLMAADGYAQGMEIGVFEPDEAARKIRFENKLMEDLLLNLSFMTFMEGQTEVEQLETLYLAENVEACLEKIPQPCGRKECAAESGNVKCPDRSCWKQRAGRDRARQRREQRDSLCGGNGERFNFRRGKCSRRPY